MAFFDWTMDLNGDEETPSNSSRSSILNDYLNQKKLREQSRAKFPQAEPLVNIKGGIASSENKNPTLEAPPKLGTPSASTAKSPLESEMDRFLGPPGQPSDYVKGVLESQKHKDEEKGFIDRQRQMLGSRFEEVYPEYAPKPPSAPDYMKGETFEDVLSSHPQKLDNFFKTTAKIFGVMKQYNPDITPDTPTPSPIGAVAGVAHALGTEVGSMIFGPILQKKQEIDDLSAQLGKDAKEDPRIIEKMSELKMLKDEQNAVFKRLQDIRGDMNFGKVVGFIALSMVLGARTAGWLILNGAEQGNLHEQFNLLGQRISLAHRELDVLNNIQARHEDTIFKARNAAAQARARLEEVKQEHASQHQMEAARIMADIYKNWYNNEQMNARAGIKYEHEDLIGKLMRDVAQKTRRMDMEAQKLDEMKSPGLPKSIRAKALEDYAQLQMEVEKEQEDIDRLMKEKAQRFGLSIGGE